MPEGRGTGTDGWGSAPDGSPVGLFARFPPDNDLAALQPVLRPGCTVLDLGCGAGRLANPLHQAGHLVTAVDMSAQMLVHVQGPEPVQADIAQLQLNRHYDVVLLASYLVNSSKRGEPLAFLTAAARHLLPGGRVLLQATRRSSFDSWRLGQSHRSGEFEVEPLRLDIVGQHVAATVRYRCGDQVWLHEWSDLLLTDAQLSALARRAGFDRPVRVGATDWWSATRG